MLGGGGEGREGMTKDMTNRAMRKRIEEACLLYVTQRIRWYMCLESGEGVSAAWEHLQRLLRAALPDPLRKKGKK